MRLQCLVISIALAANSAPTLAQEVEIPGDLCGMIASSTAEPLAGKWLITNRKGGGSYGGESVFLSDEPTEKVELEYLDGGALFFKGSGDQEMRMEPQELGSILPDEFTVPIRNSNRDATVDVSELLPCPWEEMPGFVGALDYPVPGVGAMRMEVVMNFPSRELGFGLLHFTGAFAGREIDVLRHITLTPR
ncbi:MAG TPA: hypothetical protein VLA37_04400 [Sphingomonadaceae bacterium]|nr:hypothetical protein [Sphingomonadaceae bacterium]